MAYFCCPTILLRQEIPVNETFTVPSKIGIVGNTINLNVNV